MEQNNPFDQQGIAQSTEKNLFDLQVDHETTSYLGETARWAKFLAIIGFIFCGLIAIFGIFAGTIFSTSMVGFSRYGFSGSGFSFFFLILYAGIALLYFFPCLYLFNFASRMQVALRNSDQVQLNTSFKNLKSCYKFMGILMIVFLSLYGLVILGAILGSAFR